MNRHYQLNVLRELRDQQVRYTPREKKVEQTRNAEKLFREIKDDEVYSYRFICVGVTEFKAEMYAELKLDGVKVKHDLLLLIEDLFDSANVSVEEAGERVWTIEELSKRFNVSEKTISRWRKQGLVARKFFFGKKKRVGFLQNSVDFFLEHDPERIERGERFTQLSEKEKRFIIQTARRLFSSAGSTCSPTEITRRIARYMGRSVETVRYTLKTFDEQNADIPIFPNRNTPLNEGLKSRIFQEYQQNTTIEELAETYNRTRGSIYRIIGQIRARRINEFVLDYIDNPEFHSMTPKREKMILGEISAAPQTKSVLAKAKLKPEFVEILDDSPQTAPQESTELAEPIESAMPPYLSGLYKHPILTAEQELNLFRKMNYLKFKASELRKQHNPENPKAYLMTQIEKLYEQVVATKNEIVSANLRLVVSIAKRHVGPYSTFFDLISDGNLSLIKAVEKFDYSRGNRFSTYATWVITRNFARTIPDTKRHYDRFRLSEDEFFDATIDQRTDLHLEESYQFERERQIDHLLNRLDEREQKIIVSRFGIGSSDSPLTLNEVGIEIGVTKERVRQIEARALAKLRKVAEDENLEIPGL